MTDSARIQQVECCTGTDSDADTEEGRNNRWYVKDYHIFVHGSDGWILSDLYARKRHSLYYSEHPKRYALIVVSNTTRAK